MLERDVFARNASGAAQRIRWAGFPAARPSTTSTGTTSQLASGAFLTEARNVVLLGPPGTGKPTSPPGSA